MSVSFSDPDPDVLDLLAEVMQRHHKPLFDAQVRVGVAMAVNDKGDAVIANGYPALAKIGVTNLLNRLKKSYDAELVVDLKAYEKLSEAQKVALMDHELSHLELAEWSYRQERDVNGHTIPDPVTDEPREVIQFKTDDLGRPKLKLRKADFDAGDCFLSVIRRNGSAAIEFINLSKAKTKAQAAWSEYMGELASAIGDAARAERAEHPQPTLYAEEGAA